jgi:hypothetical protein
VAQARIDALATYISDLNGGDVTLTSEAEDLAKQIKELRSEKKQMEDDNTQRIKDYDAAKAEMDNALTALGMAINVLKEGTSFAQSGKAKANLLAYKTELGQGMAALTTQSSHLNAAVELGERYLSKADASFLRRVLTGDVPERDEKMLRKKADFKMAYKTRSGKIQNLLAKLKTTFEKNLKDATAKEDATQEDYDKLSKAKGDLLKKAQDAQTSMAKEGGARTKAGTTAEAEKKALETQVTDDTKFIGQTEDSLKKKEGEWEERTKLRDGELQAISKAINILYNDDARDNFKKSFASQEGFFFLQESSSTSIVSRAASALKKAASATGDRRLSALAELVEEAPPKSVKGRFKPILDAIDKMLVTLKSDEKTDLETKETCEEDRMENTRKALLAGRDMDEKTETIRKLTSEIEDLEADMKALLAEKKQTQDELDKADEIRKEENANFKVTNQEDKEAAETVLSATDVLKTYYSESFKAALVQKAVPVTDGEAPPPPPSTWGSSYGGKKGESTGIIAILEMVHADILKDQKKAKTEEDDSQKEFDTFKKESEKTMEDLQTEHDKKEGIVGDKEGDKTDAIKARKTKYGEWDTLMDNMKDADPNCEYYAVNFKLRAKNRALEKDGLTNAKAILSGGSFK